MQPPLTSEAPDNFCRRIFKTPPLAIQKLGTNFVAKLDLPASFDWAKLPSCRLHTMLGDVLVLEAAGTIFALKRPSPQPREERGVWTVVHFGVGPPAMSTALTWAFGRLAPA